MSEWVERLSRQGCTPMSLVVTSSGSYPQTKWRMLCR